MPTGHVPPRFTNGDLLRVSIHFPAKRKDPRLAFGILRFPDLLILHIHLRKCGPRKEVIGLQRCRFQPRPDRFFDPIRFHESHRQSVPPIKKIGVEINALLILHDGTLKIPNREVAIGIVKKIVERITQNRKD